MDNLLSKICRKYEIQPAMSKYLSRLADFEIVIVCDDSGSMMRPIDGTQRTRLDELRSIIETIAEIGVIFDSNGVDIYFLNRPPVLNVTDPADIARAFEPPPSGFMPLAFVLNEVFQSELARRERDKKLLVFVATNGDQNEHVCELEYVMREKRRVETTFVAFLLCTDDPTSVEYLYEWDRTMPNVDVTNHFRAEREKIRRCHAQKNYPFSFGDYVVKVLVGAIVPQIDALNEST